MRFLGTATIVILAIMLSGCALWKRDSQAIDRTYRSRVESFSLGIGISYQPGGVIVIGLNPTFHYRNPATAIALPTPKPLTVNPK